MEFNKLAKKVGDYVFGYIIKLKDYLDTYTGKVITKLVVRTITLIIMLIFLEFPIYLLGKLGSAIFYLTGDIFRSIASFIWVGTIHYAYTLFSLVTIYRFVKDLSYDRQLSRPFRNEKKNKLYKEKVLKPAREVLKVIICVSLIPLVLLSLLILIALGGMIGYLLKDIYLISLFIIGVGLLLSSIGIIEFITSHIRGVKSKLSAIVFTGMIIFMIGTTTLVYELQDYTYKDYLNHDIKMINESYSYDITSPYYNNIVFKTDSKVTITIDDSLKDEVLINVKHASTSESIIKNNLENKNLVIDLENNLDIKNEHLLPLFNLGIDTIKNKTLYNYPLLKYSTIEIKVSSKNSDKIKLKELDKDYF